MDSFNRAFGSVGVGIFRRICNQQLDSLAARRSVGRASDQLSDRTTRNIVSARFALAAHQS